MSPKAAHASMHDEVSGFTVSTSPGDVNYSEGSTLGASDKLGLVARISSIVSLYAVCEQNTRYSRTGVVT